MRPALLLILLLAACQDRRAPSDEAPAKPSTPAAAAPATAPEKASWTAEEQGCVDRWLAGRKLDAYGAPAGTMYSGGTPLFDETTGRSTTRQSYLAGHRPEALIACGVTP